jgi:hypothetical protein
MACSLTLRPPPGWKTSGDTIPSGLNRTERIRQLLKKSGRPLTANEIAWDMEEHFPNFGTHLVWLLLKYEMEKGRVIFDKGRASYAWNAAYDSAEQTAIRNAEKLLKRHGYLITKPTPAA